MALVTPELTRYSPQFELHPLEPGIIKVGSGSVASGAPELTPYVPQLELRPLEPGMIKGELGLVASGALSSIHLLPIAHIYH